MFMVIKFIWYCRLCERQNLIRHLNRKIAHFRFHRSHIVYICICYALIIIIIVIIIIIAIIISAPYTCIMARLYYEMASVTLRCSQYREGHARNIVSESVCTSCWSLSESCGDAFFELAWLKTRDLLLAFRCCPPQFQSYKYFRFRRPYCYIRLSVVVAIIWNHFLWTRGNRKSYGCRCKQRYYLFFIDN